MKILLLNQTFHPDVVSTAQHLTDLALELTARGHTVTVIASRRAYDAPEQRFPRVETWRGIKIHRVGSTSFGKDAKWKRAADFASFAFFCCCRLITLPRPDAVVALTSPPLISFIGSSYAWLKQGRFFYWVMDLNPDEAIAAGWLDQNSPVARLLDWMSRRSLRQSERIIALDKFMRARIEDKGIPADRIALIPPWSHDDAVRFDAKAREAFRSAHGLANKFVVMYSGNHSPCHPLDTLMEAARRLADEPQITFLFVGGGSEFGRVKRFAESHGLHNVQCLPYQPLEGLAGSLSAADLHAVVMGSAFVGTIHPCKIYNVLSVGAPVLYIGPEPSHVSEILNQLGSLVCGRVAQGDVDRCVAEIRRVAVRGQRGEAERYQPVAALFSKRTLLPQLVAELERS